MHAALFNMLWLLDTRVMTLFFLMCWKYSHMLHLQLVCGQHLLSCALEIWIWNIKLDMTWLLIIVWGYWMFTLCDFCRMVIIKASKLVLDSRICLGFPERVSAVICIFIRQNQVLVIDVILLKCHLCWNWTIIINLWRRWLIDRCWLRKRFCFWTSWRVKIQTIFFFNHLHLIQFIITINLTLISQVYIRLCLRWLTTKIFKLKFFWVWLFTSPHTSIFHI